ncbi:MAG: hypothetical protein K0R59_2345 [Sphingobacterium sp.]|nr:hypothetical protein [Sphingobacterium sp.]
MNPDFFMFADIKKPLQIKFRFVISAFVWGLLSYFFGLLLLCLAYVRYSSISFERKLYQISDYHYRHTANEIQP